MNMFSEVPEDFQPVIDQYVDTVRRNAPWISEMLGSTLDPVSPDATVCCLAAGEGEELVHVRDFVGASASMYAFDLNPPRLARNPLATTCYAIGSRTTFLPGDIRDVNRLTSILPKPPELVINRHPRIIETTDEEGNVTQSNGWWAKTLGEWAQRVKRRNGQMLMTFFTEWEMNIVQRHFQRIGISASVSENAFAPQQLSIVRGSMIAKPDGFVMKV